MQMDDSALSSTTPETVILLAGVIAIGRLIPHPGNFTPTYACALDLSPSASLPLAILTC